MGTAIINVSAAIAGENINVQMQRADDGVVLVQPVLPAGDAGALTTRQNATNGTITLAEGHAIVDGKVHVLWSGGRRYNVTASVAGTEVSISGGSGDDLPDEDSDVVVSQQLEANATVDPDDVAVLLISVNRRASVVFADAGDAVLFAIDLAAGESCLWWSGSGITRPMTGNPATQIWVGNGDSQNALTATVAALYDSTP